MLELLLQQGPYLLMAFAGGLILWGLWFVLGGSLFPMPILSLLLPCPLCLGAVAFSVYAAVVVLRLPPLFAGLCLGGAFVLTSLAILVLLRRRGSKVSTAALGLVMMVIGLYFALSPVIPAKIEEAEGMYASFLMEHQVVDIQNTLGVLGTLSVMMLIGFFAGKQRKEM